MTRKRVQQVKEEVQGLLKLCAHARHFPSFAKTCGAFIISRTFQVILVESCLSGSMFEVSHLPTKLHHLTYYFNDSHRLINFLYSP